jgi:hypothetical protein
LQKLRGRDDLVTSTANHTSITMNRKANLRLKLLTCGPFVTRRRSGQRPSDRLQPVPLRADDRYGMRSSPISRLRLGLAAACLGALVFVSSATAAVSALPSAQTYPPPTGTVFQGVATKPVSAYTNTAHKHPAIYQEFVAWGQWLPGITVDASTNRSRLMIEITTAYGSKNRITLRGIADGSGDAWLIGLAQQLAASKNITYVRLMAEMNNCNNPYAADNCDGSSRGSAYTASEFKQAWRRATLIFRGGSVSAINVELSQLGMRRLRTGETTLATPDVSMTWVPMVGGSPDVPGLQPGVYFPGKQWVDWVGTDFYSRYPNWAGLEQFYNDYPDYPFLFGEYAIWDGDNPGWVRTLFSWVNTHRRTQMLVYNDASPDFWLSHFPASAAALSKALADPRFPSYAPEWAHTSALVAAVRRSNKHRSSKHRSGKRRSRNRRR